MDGEDDSAIGLRQSVEVDQELQGGGGVQPRGRLVQEDETWHAKNLESHTQTPLLHNTHMKAHIHTWSTHTHTHGAHTHTHT